MSRVPHVLVRARETVLGHVATVGGFARGVIAPQKAPAGTPFEARVPDAVLGEVSLVGELANADAPTLVIAVHGMGGTIESPYVVRLARAAVAHGHAILRIHLRGASGDGADLYHAGLGHDIAGLVGSPALARYERIAVVGYSLGGHIALRYAADGPHDPRLAAVVAVCPPVDLERGTRAIMRLDRRPYQEYVLRSLRAQLVQVAAKGRLPVRAEDAPHIRTIREWDERIIVPRFGFPSLERFYADEAIGPRLGKIDVRTLVVIADRDPMIAIDSVTPWLPHARPPVTVVRKHRGGHVAFPDDVGLMGERGGPIEPEILRWIEAG